jgi:hypothetical protein
MGGGRRRTTAGLQLTTPAFVNKNLRSKLKLMNVHNQLFYVPDVATAVVP